MAHLSRYYRFIFPAIILTFTTCDKADGPVNVLFEEPYVRDLTVAPSSLHFALDDGVRDTVITFQLTAKSNLPDDYRLLAHIASSRDFEELASDYLEPAGNEDGLYTGSLPVENITTGFENMVIYVTPMGPGNNIGNRTETSILVTRDDTGYPVIVELDHPEEITIPGDGEPDIHFFVAAHADHTISIDMIDRVILDLYLNEGPDATTYTMSDENEDYGNVRGDGVYVQGFSLSSQNSPGTHAVEIHAVDIMGTPSDTLRSTFEFVR